MKKLISFVLCIVLIAGVMFIFPVSAEELVGVEYIDSTTFKIRMVDEDEYYYEYFKILDGVLYQYHENHAVVEAIIPDEKDAKINIPSEIICEGDSKKVSYINLSADLIADCPINENVVEINIPDSVVWICGIANAKNLKKVTVSKSVKKIEDCFYGCENLELIIDEKNTRYEVIGNELYYIERESMKLISVFTSPETYEIPSCATHFIMPFGKDNKSVKTIIVKNDIVELNLKGLNYLVYINADECSISDLKLEQNNKIRSLDLSNSKINIITVNHLKNLVSLKVPQGIKNINAYGCVKLSKVNLPKSIKRIRRLYFAKTGFKKFIVPNSVTKIAPHAFSLCNNLKEIVISGSVKKIRVNTFYGCKNLSKIVLKHKKAPKIYEGAFNKIKGCIKFYVRNKKVAKQLKRRLKGKVEKAKIYANGKLIYKI